MRTKMAPEKKAQRIQQIVDKRKNRLQTRAELMSSYNHNSATSHPAIQIVLKEFFKAIDQGPTFVCICCNRFLYHLNVLPFSENNFNNKTLLTECVPPHTSLQQQQWICTTCSRTIKGNTVPAQATINKMEVEPIPPILKELCHVERQLVCLVLTFMLYIVTLHKGAQKGLHGQVVLVPAKVQETVKSLPRQTSDSQVIALNFKRRLTDNSPRSKQYIKA
jgi:hypothetical protein